MIRDRQVSVTGFARLAVGSQSQPHGGPRLATRYDQSVRIGYIRSCTNGALSRAPDFCEFKERSQCWVGRPGPAGNRRRVVISKWGYFVSIVKENEVKSLE